VIVNIDIITICNIFELYKIDECNKFCNPYGYYKIPFFELLILLNIYLFYKYQAIGYRFLFIISLSKSISSVIINFNHIKNETINTSIIYNDIYKLYGNIIFNLLIISVTEFLYLYANIKSYFIIKKDWEFYNKIYDDLKEKETSQLNDFNSILKNIKYDDNNIKQKIDNLDELYDIGFLLNVKFQKILYAITKKTSGILVPSTVKNPKRSIEKICRHYNRDTTMLCDIMRASILFCNNNKCNGKCYNCKILLSNEYEEKDIIIKIKKSISVCDNFLDIHNNTSNINDISKKLDDILDISNRSDKNIIQPYLPSLSPIKSTKRSSIFDDVNLSYSFTNHIQSIKSNINKISCDSNINLGNYNLCSNMLLFIKELNNNNHFKIIKIKNRFDDKYNSRMSLGYRDILINIKIQYEIEEDKIRFLNYTEWNDKNKYIIAEIQLHSIEMYNYKVHNGHENYKRYRNIMTI
jgi:hypothetical protein